MTLTDISSLESARRKFFMNSTYMMSKLGIKRVRNQTLFGHDVQTEAEMTLTAITSLESARRKFFMNSTYMMST